jgi:IclR family transcriptional regulator, KDG regulon repressor
VTTSADALGSKGNGSAPARIRVDSTVTKALLLFETLAASDLPMGVSAIGEALDLQKSNVHRLLHTLMLMGYVQQDPDTKRYTATLKVWEIGSNLLRRNALRVVARPVLVELSRNTSEAAFLSVLSGTDMVYLDTVDSPLVPALAPTGSRAPAVFPASGKALLANQKDPEAALDQIISTVPQAARLDKEAMLREFEEIRKNGYATSSGGWRRGRSAVAAAIPRANMPPTAAVGVGGPTEAMTPRRMVEIAGAVMDAAERIAEVSPLSDSAARLDAAVKIDPRRLYNGRS